MNLFVLLFINFIFFFPLASFGFSETEIDSLESSGKKSFSTSPWRTNLGFSLQRNLELNSRYWDFQVQQNETEEEALSFRELFNPKKEGALTDPSNLYYGLNLNINYSLRDVKLSNNNYVHKLLKNTELFLVSSFQTPITGYNSNLKDYNASQYVKYALGNLVGGWTSSIYQKNNFLSDFSFSVILLPLSLFSIEAGLYTTADGTISLLYFLKKTNHWNVAVSSSHNLSYSYYEKETADIKGLRYNIPWDTKQTGSFIFRQSYNKYLPGSVRFFTSYYLGIDTYKGGTRLHDLSLGSTYSWKLRDRFHLSCSLSWKDRIYRSNPNDPFVRKKEAVRWFNRDRTSFALNGSYSF